MTDTDKGRTVPAPTPTVDGEAPYAPTVESVLAEMRQRRDSSAELTAGRSAAYRDGINRGWAAAIALVEPVAGRTRISEVSMLETLRDEVHANAGKIIGPAHTAGTPVLPETVQARHDVRDMTERLIARTLNLALRAERERAEREAALGRKPWEDEVDDWSGYPLVPMPGDMIVDDFSTLALFLGGSGDSFTGDLLRLIAKADPTNLQQIALGFPRHVRAFLMWRACAPVPVRSLVALLNASTMIKARDL